MKKVILKIKDFFKPVDLTQGTTWKVLLLFALPVFLSSILDNAFSLINSLVLKTTVGGDSVTAIGSTSSISMILFNFSYGCSGGFAVIAANKIGEKKYEDLNKVLYSSMILSLIIAITISIIGFCTYKDLLTILNVDQRYIEKASNYYQIILIAYPLMVIGSLFGNFLRALGNSIAPLLISFGHTLLNIVFAFLFTGVIHLDTRGVAFATLIGNLFYCVVCIVYMFKKYPYLRPHKESFKLEKNLTLNLLKLGFPLGLQWSILFIGSFVQSGRINLYGNGLATKAVTCYQPFESYLTLPLSVMASSLLNFVGQNYGAKNKERIKKGIKQALTIDIIIYLLAVTIGLLFAEKVPYIFMPANEINDPINGPRIIYYCSTYLKVLAPCLILQGILQLSRSSLQGIKKPLIPFLSGVGELIARILVCLYLPSLFDPNNPLSDTGYLGLCFSTPAAWLASFIIMGSCMIYFIFIKNLKELDKITETDD